MTKKTEQKLTKIDRSKLKNKKPAPPASTKPEPDARGQLNIPGTAPKHHRIVSEAAEKLSLAKERCKSANDHKKHCEFLLVGAMKKAGETHYVDRGLNIEVHLENVDRVSVKHFNHDDDDDNDLTT